MKSIGSARAVSLTLIKASLIGLVVSALSSAAFAQVVDLPPTPEWIQPVGAQTNQSIFLRKTSNANNSKALVRLRDLDGDGKFDETVELLHTDGGVGHGRNHLKLGPDGWIYIAHGNNVLLPTNTASTSPLKRYADDRLIPCPWDRATFDGDVALPAAHILRFDPGRQPIRFEVVAGGFRNPMDIAFNQDRELFTFDADMEWDVGAPWYMPNRVLHVISGADFGWRRGTGRFPQHFADTLPSTLDIGLASPTGVIFGYGSRFPAKYQEALFILDWAYGRILAVHLQPEGASYRATSELFIAGRPLNVTDACIGPDRALWFITGGRKTQSGLYRATYAGPDSVEASQASRSAAGDEGAAQARALRQQLEAFHRGVEPARQREALATLWPHLGDADRWIRHAARVSLENIEPSAWQEKGLREPEASRALTALLALARVSGTNVQASILDRLNQRTLTGFTEEQMLMGLRVYALALTRLGQADEALRTTCLARLEPLYPAAAWQLNHELCELLVHLNSTSVISRTLSLLRPANRSEDLLQYLFDLRYVRTGWSLDQRRQFFEALAHADSLPGARQYVKALLDIRREVIDSLTPVERDALKPDQARDHRSSFMASTL